MARGRRHHLHARRIRQRQRRMDERAGYRSLARAALLSRRRLLLGLGHQPSPPRKRGRPRSRCALPRNRLPARTGTPLSRPRSRMDCAHGLHCRRSGIEARHIAVAGDSAGGGLSVALANELREAGEDRPGCLWLISPWTDLTLSGPTLASKDADDPLIHKPYLEELASAYVAGRIERRDPRVSVLFADLKNLPPMLIQVGSDETLLSDATRFAEAAGCRRCRRHARNLAANDSCLAVVEWRARRRPRGDHTGRRIHPSASRRRYGADFSNCLNFVHKASLARHCRLSKPLNLYRLCDWHGPCNRGRTVMWGPPE